MRIHKIRIHNYRSIRDLEIVCQPLVVMLGPNNHGKSNILSAIDFALSPSGKPNQSDFCAFCGDDKKLWVELVFHELSDLERTIFARYIQADGTFCFRKTAHILENDSIEVSYNGYLREPIEWWLKSENIQRLTARDEANLTPLSELIPASGRLNKGDIKTAQARYIEEHNREVDYQISLEDEPFLGRKNIAEGVLPDFYLIPAIRDLADETKVKNTTIFGRMLSRAVQEMAAEDPSFLDLKIRIDKLIKSLNRSAESGSERPSQLIGLEESLKIELNHWGVDVEIEIVPPAIEKILEIGTNLYLDDGVRTLAEQKGNGLQRAVIFALIRSWAKALHTTRSQDASAPASTSSETIIFAIEEPELFLHPHAQRKLAQAIQEISEIENHQVFVCSHSTYFVDLDYYKNICMVIKNSPEDGTKIRQCAIDLFEGGSLNERKKRFHIARWVNPERGEMFFAKKTVFVEGETEKTLMPFLAQKLGCFDQEISIIDCGSKHNLPLYIAIANAFEIQYVVIHDEDPLPATIPSTWNPDKQREKRRTFELNEEIRQVLDPRFGSIQMLSPDFEGLTGVSRAQGEKKGKALAALDYFETIRQDEIPTQIEEVIRAIYRI